MKMAETIEELPPEKEEEEEPREEPPEAPPEAKPKRVRKKPEPPPPPPPPPEPRGRGRPRKPDEELKRPRGPPRKPKEKKPVELSPDPIVPGDNSSGGQMPAEDTSQQDLWRLARLFGSRLGDIQQESKHIKREKTRTLFRNSLLV